MVVKKTLKLQSHTKRVVLCRKGLKVWPNFEYEGTLWRVINEGLEETFHLGYGETICGFLERSSWGTLKKMLQLWDKTVWENCSRWKEGGKKHFEKFITTYDNNNNNNQKLVGSIWMKVLKPQYPVLSQFHFPLLLIVLHISKKIT